MADSIDMKPRQRDTARATRRLAVRIAREFWTLYAQNGRVDWNGVERHMRRIVKQARQVDRVRP